MVANDIILQTISKEELLEMLQKMVHEEFDAINLELQKVIGEDDLVSTGTACRIIGVCSKVLKVLVDQGYFTVFWHLRERRYKRGELLEYRNAYRIKRKRSLPN